MRRLPCVILGVVVFATVAPLSAQWLQYRDPAVPRTKDGKPNLSAPTPRAVDGRPDLTGVWMHELTSAEEMRRLYGPIIDEAIKVDAPGMQIGTQHKYVINILLDAKSPEPLMRPETAAIVARRLSQPLMDFCSHGEVVVPGIPVVGLLSEPIKMVQAPRLTLILYEGGLPRQIYTDGRRLPQEFDLPAYLGYSVGRWENDTFVVETAGFNDKTVLDLMGHPHSDRLRVLERFRRRDFGHMDVDMTFDDPARYTKPFTIHVPHDLLPDADIFEYVVENEKDCARIGKK